jgi:hypothetical protein
MTKKFQSLDLVIESWQQKKFRSRFFFFKVCPNSNVLMKLMRLGRRQYDDRFKL